MRPAHLKPASILAQGKPHGTRIKYMGGCHCMLCRAANSRYETGRAVLRRAGLDNGITNGVPARKHILFLSRNGIGRRALSDAAGVSVNVICKIRNGEREHIRRETERRILAVTIISAAKGKTLIDARPMWKLIRKLLKGGFTKKKIAKILGYKSPALQLNASRVTARNAVKIKHLYDMVMAI